MKNEIIRALVLCSVTSLSIVGCSSNDETTQVTLDTETPQEVSKVTIRLQDVDGKPVENTPVTFDDNETGLLGRFAGRSSLQSKTKTITSDALGFVTIELKKGTTEGDLSISINQAGYFPVTEIFKVGGDKTVDTLTLTPKPPAGVTLGVSSDTNEEVISIVADQAFKKDETVTVKDNSGADVVVQGSVAEVKASTTKPGETEKEVVAEVLIPNSVKATTDSGTEASGDLKITAAVYQNSADEAVDAFPGGLVLDNNLTNATGAPLTPNTGATDPTDTTGFITAGFVALEVKDAKGNDITKFSGSTGVDLDGDGKEEQGLLVTTLVPKATIHPTTGKPVAMDDTIPVWSYNEENAKWTFDGNAQVFEEADAKNWRARFAATHLSYWNLDFRVSYCSNHSSGENALIEFKTAENGSRDNRMLVVSTFRNGLGYYATRTVNMDGYVSGYLPRESIKLTVLDANNPSKVVKIKTINGAAYDPAVGFNFCNNQSSGNDIVLEQPVTSLVDVSVKVETSCSDSTLDSQRPPEAIPSTNVFLFNSNNTQLLSQTTTNASGEVTLTGLDSDTQYNITVENRLAGPGASFEDAYKTRKISKAGTAENPEVFDFEQTCKVTTTTGSGGGN